jgi:YVTN family beta-propeller protein
MGYGRYVGRVGGLAVALGVGVAVATTPGIAWADDTGSPASSDTSTGSSDSTTSSSGTEGTPTGSTATTTTNTSTTAGAPTGGGGSTPTVTYDSSGGALTSANEVGAVSNTESTSSPGTAAKPKPKPKTSGKSGSDYSASSATKAPKRLSVTTETAVGDDTASSPSTQRVASVQDPVGPLTGRSAAHVPVQLSAGPAALRDGTAADSAVQAMASAPAAGNSAVSRWKLTVLSAVGFAPLADGDVPQTPGESPLALVGLAALRRQTQQSFTGDEQSKLSAEPTQSSLTLASADAGTGGSMLMAAAVTNSAPNVPTQPTGIPDPVTGVVSGRVVATDVDGNPLSYSVSPTSVKGGAVSINSTTGAYTYTPTQAARLAAGTTTGADTDTFTVTVSDGQTTTTSTVPVYVSPTQLTTGSPIVVGNQPDGIAAYENTSDPTKNRTYVINQYDKTVSVIDTNPTSTKYNQVIGTIKLASTPSDIVVNSAGTRAYVTMKGNASVAVIDTATMKVVDVNPSTSTVDSIKVGSTPAGIAISPDGTRLYVTNSGSSTVSVIDTTLNKEISRITVGSQPSGIAVSPDGNKLYVTLRYSDSLATVNLANNLVSTVKVGDSPREVALTPDGTRAVVTNYDGTVSVVDITTTTPKVVATITTGGPKLQPAGVAISADGTLAYVANGKDTVSVFDTKTNTIIRTITIDSAPESGAHYVALSADGTRIYVTDLNDDNVRTLSLTRGNTAPLVIANPTVGAPDSSTGAVTGLVNVKDPDGDAVTLSTVSAPNNGTVNYNSATGTYTYTPTAAARQQAAQGTGPTSDTFIVRVTDPYGTFKDASVTVPIAPAQPITVNQTAVAVGSGPSGTAIVGNRAYVVNTDSNSVSVIDTTTKQVTQTIITGIGSGPLSVVASPSTNRVYVANANDNTVSVIDTTSNTVVKNIAVPVQPSFNPEYGEIPNYLTDLAVSSDGKRLYTTASDGTISVINTDPLSGSSYNTVISTQPLGSFSDLEISADGSRLYGTHYGYYSSPTLDVINTGRSAGDAMTNAGSIQVGPQWNLDAMQSEFTEDTYNVAASPDGKRLYVTYGVTQVARGVGGQTSGEFITDSRGQNWLITGRYSAVSVIDTNPASATYNTEIARITVPAGAQDVAFSPDGKTAYVTSWDGKTVTLIDTATNTVINSFTTDQTTAGPRSIGFYGDGYFTRLVTVAPDGTLYITDYTDGKVYAVTGGSTAQQM